MRLPLKSWPQRGAAAAVIAVCAAALMSHAHVKVRLKPDTSGSAVVFTPDTPTEAADPIDRKLGCARQAARMAEWRGRGTSGVQVHEAAWLGHYSDRDDVCYALMTRNVTTNVSGEPPLVTELWNAFEATLLATSTNDRRADVRRDFCRIDFAEDPFTSCLVAEFFIRQHMAN